MNQRPDNPISPDSHPAHNMHETCQSSCLTMPSHNELRGCSGASQLWNCASVRLSAIIHSFWRQSLSIQVSAGLQNEPKADTHTQSKRRIGQGVKSKRWKLCTKRCLRTSMQQLGFSDYWSPQKCCRQNVHAVTPTTASPSLWQQLIDMKWLHMADEPQICTFHKVSLKHNGQRWV